MKLIKLKIEKQNKKRKELVSFSLELHLLKKTTDTYAHSLMKRIDRTYMLKQEKVDVIVKVELKWNLPYKYPCGMKIEKICDCDFSLCALMQCFQFKYRFYISILRVLIPTFFRIIKPQKFFLISKNHNLFFDRYRTKYRETSTQSDWLELDWMFVEWLLNVKCDRKYDVIKRIRNLYTLSYAYNRARMMMIESNPTQ